MLHLRLLAQYGEGIYTQNCRNTHDFLLELQNRKIGKLDTYMYQDSTYYFPNELEKLRVPFRPLPGVFRIWIQSRIVFRLHYFSARQTHTHKFDF